MEAILLNSGGMDSAVVAAMCKQDGHILHSLFIDLSPYNHDRAVVAAQKIADLYCADHLVFPFPFDWNQPTGSLFGVRGTQYITTSLALGYAMKLGVGYVLCGLKAESNANPWMDNIQSILSENLITTPPLVMAPLKDMDNAAMIAKAAELGLNLDFTCSCNRGPQPCGVCAKCQLRAANGIALN